MIDTNGQIVKMVRDEESAHQAGVSFWSGVNGVNDNSIGIEIVNRSGAYPAAQYTALLGLLDRLLAAHTGIDRRRIVGHSDIATDGHGVLGRKSLRPGPGIRVDPSGGPQPGDGARERSSMAPDVRRLLQGRAGRVVSQGG